MKHFSLHRQLVSTWYQSTPTPHPNPHPIEIVKMWSQEQKWDKWKKFTLNPSKLWKCDVRTQKQKWEKWKKIYPHPNPHQHCENVIFGPRSKSLKSEKIDLYNAQKCLKTVQIYWRIWKSSVSVSVKSLSERKVSCEFFHFSEKSILNPLVFDDSRKE